MRSLWRGASWCPSCVDEIPILNQWHQKYASSGAVSILGVNVLESRERIKTFLSDNSIDFPVLLDSDGETAEQYGISGLPVTVFLAKGGKILYYGFSLPENLEELIQKSLRV